MTTTIDRLQLLKALNACKRALTSKGNVPVLASYCFTGDAVYAFDGVVAIYAQADIGGFVGAVPGDALRRWLEIAPGDRVTVDTDESSTVWKSGKRKLGLEALPAADFAIGELPVLDTWIELDDHFQDYLRVAATSIGTDDRHEWRLGVTLSFASEKSIEFLASDNITVACVEAEYQVPEVLRGTARVIPPQAVAALLAMKERPLFLGITHSWTYFTFDNGQSIIVRATVDADAGRFASIVDGGDWSGNFAKVSEGLERSLREICAVAKTTDLVRARLRVNDGELRIYCSDGIVSIEDVTSFESDGAKHGDADIFTNPMLLERALTYVDEIRLTDRAILLRSDSVRVLVSTLSG